MVIARLRTGSDTMDTPRVSSAWLPLPLWMLASMLAKQAAQAKATLVCV
jgi:hypothetical protein